MALDDINVFYVRNSLLPPIVFTAFMMVTGIIGNGLVLLVYRKDFHKSVAWIFVYFLAILDMCACVISLPTELVLFLTIASFPSSLWCRISRYISFVFYVSTCVVLMVIAFSRYDKICSSTRQWFTTARAKKSCIAVVLLNLIINVPALVIYGEFNVPFEVFDDGDVKLLSKKEYLARLNLTTHPANASISNIEFGKLCSITKEYYDSITVTAFFFFQFALFIILVALVVFFYTKVIGKLLKHNRKLSSRFRWHNPDDDKTSSNRNSRKASKSVVSSGEDSTSKRNQRQCEVKENIHEDITLKEKMSDDLEGEVCGKPEEEVCDSEDRLQITSNQILNAQETAEHDLQLHIERRECPMTNPVPVSTSCTESVPDCDGMKAASEEVKETQQDAKLINDVESTRKIEGVLRQYSDASKNNSPNTENDESKPEGRKARKKLVTLSISTQAVDSKDSPAPLSPAYRNRADSLFSPSLKTRSYNKRRMSVEPVKALRTSGMLLCVSLAFVLSFLPSWIILIWRTVVGPSFVTSMSPAVFGIFTLFIRSSTISNVINPVMYGVLNSGFRQRCKALWRK